MVNHSDGYAGYHDLGEKITIVGCWAHARRKFDETRKSRPKCKEKSSSIYQGLAYCDLLFANTPKGATGRVPNKVNTNAASENNTQRRRAIF